MWWWHDSMPWIMFWPFGLVICVVMIIMMMRHGRNGQRRGDPLDILRERFARGEIAEKEYEDRRRLLSQP